MFTSDFSEFQVTQENIEVYLLVEKVTDCNGRELYHCIFNHFLFDSFPYIEAKNKLYCDLTRNKEGEYEAERRAFAQA